MYFESSSPDSPGGGRWGDVPSAGSDPTASLTFPAIAESERMQAPFLVLGGGGTTILFKLAGFFFGMLYLSSVISWVLDGGRDLGNGLSSLTESLPTLVLLALGSTKRVLAVSETSAASVTAVTTAEAFADLVFVGMRSFLWRMSNYEAKLLVVELDLISFGGLG